MLRDLLDIAWLEDFVSGLARCTGLRALVFDARGGLIVASAPNGAFTKLGGLALSTLPPLDCSGSSVAVVAVRP